MNNTITINNTLTLSYPEGFYVMDPAEREKLPVVGKSDFASIKDPDRHILIAADFKPLGRLASMFMNARDAAGNTWETIRKPLRSCGLREYGAVCADMGGEQAEGFSYGYTVQGIDMFAQYLAVKRGKVIYALHFFVREALREEGLKIWNEILSALQWS